jgi:hypothetical protein
MGRNYWRDERSRRRPAMERGGVVENPRRTGSRADQMRRPQVHGEIDEQLAVLS